MNGERIFAAIIMMGCGFGCGALFYGIGVWAKKRKDPMHFWSGSVVDPKAISDVPAYNRANARMWKIFSAPFWLTGAAAIASIFDARFSTVCTGLITLGCTVGIGWLIWKYHRICKQYKA